MQGRPSLFSDLRSKTQRGRGSSVLSLCSFIKFRSVVAEENSKMCQPIKGQCGHLFSRSARKTEFVEDVEILLPVTFEFCSAVAQKVENVLANQTTERPSWFWFSCTYMEVANKRCFKYFGIRLFLQDYSK